MHDVVEMSAGERELETAICRLCGKRGLSPKELIESLPDYTHYEVFHTALMAAMKGLLTVSLWSGQDDSNVSRHTVLFRQY